MNTQEISAVILSNVASDVTAVQASKESLIAVGRNLIAKNVDPILACADEQQLLDVITEIVNTEVSDDYIKNLLDKYVPIYIKPFESMIIHAGRGILVGIIIKFLHESVLDKYAGQTWFAKLQDMCKQLKGV